MTPGAWRRGPLLVAGILCLGLGLVGIAVPLLPTTPFLLLAAACFLRSSERLHRWLVGHRVLGPYLRREGGGIPPAALVVMLVLLWTSLAVSAFLAVPSRLGWVRLLLLAVGVGVTTLLLRSRAPRGPDEHGTMAP